MRKTLTTTLVAFAVVAATPALPDSFTGQNYLAADLLLPCKEADSDAREGAPYETECEQYIMGFADALREVGMTGSAAGLCPPEVNTADEIRWAYIRWIYGDYSTRTGMPAADALLQAIRESFPCGG